MLPAALGALRRRGPRPLRPHPRPHRGAGLRRVRPPGAGADAGQARRRRPPPAPLVTPVDRRVAGARRRAAMIAFPLARRGERSGARWISDVVVGGLAATTTAARRPALGLAARRGRRRRSSPPARSPSSGSARRPGVPFGRYRLHRSAAAGGRRGAGRRAAGVVGDGAAGARGRPRRARRALDAAGARSPLGAVALTAWDLFLDPQMTAEGYWRWPRRRALPRHPAVQLRRLAGDRRRP